MSRRRDAHRALDRTRRAIIRMSNHCRLRPHDGTLRRRPTRSPLDRTATASRGAPRDFY
jgi:hypothetical protein